MKRTVLIALALALIVLPAQAEEKTRLSVVTGGTGGVYYPLGGAVANVLSKYMPGGAATAEVTSASIDNLKLIGAGKADIAVFDAGRVRDTATFDEPHQYADGFLVVIVNGQVVYENGALGAA